MLTRANKEHSKPPDESVVIRVSTFVIQILNTSDYQMVLDIPVHPLGAAVKVMKATSILSSQMRPK